MTFTYTCVEEICHALKVKTLNVFISADIKQYTSITNYIKYGQKAPISDVNHGEVDHILEVVIENAKGKTKQPFKPDSYIRIYVSLSTLRTIWTYLEVVNIRKDERESLFFTVWKILKTSC